MSQINIMPAREAKNHFGELLDAAQRAPIHITKNGRGIAVVLSMEDFRGFEEAEDALWAARAKLAHEKGGYLGASASETLLKDLLDA